MTHLPDLPLNPWNSLLYQENGRPEAWPSSVTLSLYFSPILSLIPLQIPDIYLTADPVVLTQTACYTTICSSTHHCGLGVSKSTWRQSQLRKQSLLLQSPRNITQAQNSGFWMLCLISQGNKFCTKVLHKKNSKLFKPDRNIYPVYYLLYNLSLSRK